MDFIIICYRKVKADVNGFPYVCVCLLEKYCMISIQLLGSNYWMYLKNELNFRIFFKVPVQAKDSKTHKDIYNSDSLYRNTVQIWW